ncbi:hypothetical protein BVC80_633g37 [Macleaya cordata]|uniref:Uncharacterized protein n=1 Tax=Macleaya cordata TaxID=56857 RepID=A0A200QN18_MACCD|nr:hypothetical protein BVC80_633g37 [Macleaya cordata]
MLSTLFIEVDDDTAGALVVTEEYQVQDGKSDILEPYVGMEFEDSEKLCKFFKEYGKKLGFQ